jgi:hypothetical protein
MSQRTPKRRKGARHGTAARWDDAAALATALASIPSAIAAEVCRGRAKYPAGFSGMRHDPTDRRAFYIIASAVSVQVVTLPPCSFQHAAEVWAILDNGPRPITLELVWRVFSGVTGTPTISAPSAQRQDPDVA